MRNDMSPIRLDSLLDLTSFLEGRTFAWGIFEDRFGRVRRRFTVEMVGRWQERVFLLDERFTYDDGSRETRVWRVEPSGQGRFTATCADCIGIAQGECSADAIRMSYTFRLKLDGRELHVTFDDRIYRARVQQAHANLEAQLAALANNRQAHASRLAGIAPGLRRLRL